MRTGVKQAPGRVSAYVGEGFTLNYHPRVTLEVLHVSYITPPTVTNSERGQATNAANKPRELRRSQLASSDSAFF